MAAKRDYTDEMNRYLEKHEPDGDAVLATYATKILEDLQENNPQLLRNWTMDHAEHLLKVEVRRRWILGRSVEHNTRGVFASVVASGDEDRLAHLFAERCFLPEQLTWRPIGDLRGPDHKELAKDFHSKSVKLAVREAFHLAVAKKVGRRRTEDVLTADQYANLYLAMVGED